MVWPVRLVGLRVLTDPPGIDSQPTAIAAYRTLARGLEAEGAVARRIAKGRGNLIHSCPQQTLMFPQTHVTHDKEPRAP